MSTQEEDAADDHKKKRKPGRPKSATPNSEIFQLRLTPELAARLGELATAGNCSRPHVLRTAIKGGVVLMSSVTQAAVGRQAAELANGLRQLEQVPDLGERGQAQVQVLVSQVTALLTTLHNRS